MAQGRCNAASEDRFGEIWTMKIDELGRVEISLLALAYRRKQGIDPTSVASKIGIPLRQMARAVSTLISRNYVIEKESRYFLTTEGRDAVLANQWAFVFKGERVWRNVPSKFTSHSLPAWEPYAPRIRLLDKKTFRLQSRKTGVKS